MHGDVRVVQGADVLPGVVEKVSGLAAYGEEDVYGGVVTVFPGLAERFFVFFWVEVFSPNCHPKICQVKGWSVGWLAIVSCATKQQ